MEEVEKWLDVPHYAGLYQVSSLGRIWSVRKQRILKTTLNSYGYERIFLRTPTGKKREERIHRLVALAFLPNPNKYPVINHKNEIKTDNRVDNLEWCTVQYNVKYSSYKWTGANNPMKKPENIEKLKAACKHAHDFESRAVLDTITGISYKSIRDASREIGISRHLIKHLDRFIVSEKGEKIHHENQT